MADIIYNIEGIYPPFGVELIDKTTGSVIRSASWTTPVQNKRFDNVDFGREYELVVYDNADGINRTEVITPTTTTTTTTSTTTTTTTSTTITTTTSTTTTTTAPPQAANMSFVDSASTPADGSSDFVPNVDGNVTLRIRLDSSNFTPVNYRLRIETSGSDVGIISGTIVTDNGGDSITSGDITGNAIVMSGSLTNPNDTNDITFQMFNTDTSSGYYYGGGAIGGALLLQEEDIVFTLEVDGNDDGSFTSQDTYEFTIQPNFVPTTTSTTTAPPPPPPPPQPVTDARLSFEFVVGNPTFRIQRLRVTLNKRLNFNTLRVNLNSVGAALLIDGFSNSNCSLPVAGTSGRFDELVQYTVGQFGQREQLIDGGVKTAWDNADFYAFVSSAIVINGASVPFFDGQIVNLPNGERVTLDLPNGAPCIEI